MNELNHSDDYLARLRQRLKQFSASEQDEILAEIESHIAEGLEDPRMGAQEKEKQANVLAELGSPTEMADGLHNTHKNASKRIKRKLQEQSVISWAIGLNLWVLFCLYFEWLFRDFLPFGDLGWLFVMVPVGFFNAFVLFVQFHLSVAIFSICLGLMVLALIRARRRPLVMLSFLLFLFAYGAWPLTVEKYEPAIQPAAGYKMQLVTDTSYFGSAIKSKLRRYNGHSCDYELLGWDESNMLYYESNCFGKRAWRYDPISGQNLSISRIPAGTELEPAVSRSIYGEQIAYPTYFKDVIVSFYIDGSAYSKDEKWTAMESRHIYSVYDIVVFSKE